LVMRGAGSALFPRDAAERMRRTLPNGKLQVVHGAGHAIMVDNPTAFVANVLPFLRGRAQLGARDPLVETLR
jgi:pimeloyl-ACP methyl ester carboxylesterase